MRSRSWISWLSGWCLACISCSVWCAFPALEVEDVLKNNGIHLGTTNLSEIQSIYGVSVPLQSGEHGPTTMCYLVARTNLDVPINIILEAGPLGGWKRITGFELSAISIDTHRPGECKESMGATQLAGHLIELGLGVGKDKAWFLRRFGKPHKATRNRLEYRTESRVQSDEAPASGAKGLSKHAQHGIDVVYNFIVILSAGKAIRVRWTKTEST